MIDVCGGGDAVCRYLYCSNLFTCTFRHFELWPSSFFVSGYTRPDCRYSVCVCNVCLDEELAYRRTLMFVGNALLRQADAETSYGK